LFLLLKKGEIATIAEPPDLRAAFFFSSPEVVAGECCHQAIALTTWIGWVRIPVGSRAVGNRPIQ
jgi:hypothetical protein